MNNVNILQKCVDILKADDSRKDYVLGMLETLIEINSKEAVTISTPAYPTILSKNEPLPTNTYTTNGDDIPEFLKPGPRIEL